MIEPSKKEMQAGFLSLDLQKLRKDAEEVAGGWNGEDDRFQVGGTIYAEDDAHLAQEIVEACEKLESLLNEVLGNKYYKLLKMRWVEGKTLEEVGKEFGVTRERIRQIENNLIEYLEEIDPLPANCEYLKKL